MSALNTVRRLVERLSPEPICDDCIAGRLESIDREQADEASRELAGSHGFERRKAPCGLCGETRVVIRHR